ncbi:hypothetical protein [Kitasatospora sp. NBC_01266]|uniref:hypothetical protein n=1 Tax=Kitasatospora sp. NBC_01266 TaxID=2903572 RepID=UPI002E3106A7|nr:hypothetical protein [Kitasatospora sp. NBC_01266]
MASTPHNSLHGPPRDDNTDGPTAGGSSDPNAPTPAYAADPYLQVVWGDAPAITGDVGPQGSGNGGGGHRNHPAISVDLESIRDCENGILGQARSSVADYMHLKELCRAAIDGGAIWGQQAMEKVHHPGGAVGVHGIYVQPRPDTLEADGPVQQAGTAYAQVMNPVMSEVLFDVASAIESVGQFVVLLNRAGQQYAHADIGSFFPDPPPPVVTT